MARKIGFINTFWFGSTGNIVADLNTIALKAGYETFAIFSRSENKRFSGKQYQISPKRLPYIFSRAPSLVFGGDGFKNHGETKKAIKILEEEKPDIIHLHNIHGTFLDVREILSFCKEKNIRVVWTLHDAWVVTGRCGYFFDCEKWKEGCRGCKNTKSYPRSIVRSEPKYLKIKRKMIESNPDIVFVSPSEWLKGIVLEAYPHAKVEVIRNGIETSVFKRGEPLKEVKEFAKGRFIVGFANIGMGENKGYSDMISLAKMCEGDDNLAFFIIGAEKTSIKTPNLMFLEKGRSREDMVRFYSSIDVFADVTKLDNYPTTHLEALSCGAPVISYDVGGACEMIDEGVNGFRIPFGDLSMFRKRLLEAAKGGGPKPSSDDGHFDKEVTLAEYLDVYSKLV